MENQNNNLKNYGPAVVAVILLAAGFILANAFTSPNQNPPAGNVSPPVTVDTTQTITGSKTFNPSSGSTPFSVDSSKKGLVENLNSGFLRGYSAYGLGFDSLAGLVRVGYTYSYYFSGCVATSCQAYAPGICNLYGHLEWGNGYYVATCSEGVPIGMAAPQVVYNYGYTCSPNQVNYLCLRNGTWNQQVIADFGCSIDNANWYDCSLINVQVGTRVYFRDLSTVVQSGTSIVSWAWTFQDGSPASSSSQNPSSVFGSTGAKQVTLTITGNLGQSDTKQRSLNTQTVELPF